MKAFPKMAMVASHQNLPAIWAFRSAFFVSDSFNIHNMPNKHIDVTVKASALALTDIAKWKDEEASNALNHAISRVQISRIRKTAIERGYKPGMTPQHQSS